MYSGVACSEMVIYFLNRKEKQYNQVEGSRSLFGGLGFEGPQRFYFTLLPSFSPVCTTTQVFYVVLLRNVSLIFSYGMQTFHKHFVMTGPKSNLGSSNLQKVESLLLNQSLTCPGSFHKSICLN